MPIILPNGTDVILPNGENGTVVEFVNLVADPLDPPKGYYRVKTISGRFENWFKTVLHTYNDEVISKCLNNFHIHENDP